MKRLLYLVFAAGLLTTGYSDEYDNLNGSDLIRKISVRASDINGYSDVVHIREVHAVVNGETILAVANWEDGFEMDLPVSVNNIHLTDANRIGGSSVTVSDPNAHICELSLFAHGQNPVLIYDPVIYRLYYGDRSAEPDNITTITYVYADRDFTITGQQKGSFTMVYDCSLKKGWNRVSHKIVVTDGDKTHTVTTSIPTGLEWIMEK